MVCKSHIQHRTFRNVLRVGTLLVCLFACAGIYAQDTIRAKSRWLDDYPKHVGFTYSVGADVVSNYIWRGLYVSGLGVQPDLTVGYGGLYLNLWGSVNAMDWTFLQFYPEVDLTLGFSRWGLDVKCMAMYYFTGWDKYTQEWRVKYRVSNKLPLHIMLCTRTFGKDYIMDENQKRAYSSYMEIGYEFALPYQMTLYANLGMTPWKSLYTFYQGNFAVVDFDVKLMRSFDLSKHCYMTAFAQMMLNPYDISRSASRDDYSSVNGGRQVLWNIGCGFYLK